MSAPTLTTTAAAVEDNARASASMRLLTAVPPTREAIGAFMQRYTAHLPFALASDHTRLTGEVEVEAATAGAPPASSRVAPYLYSGADYALVLAACFPSHVVDLALLNWSASPLPAQRLGNLRVFCDAARALGLPDAPLSALHPELLQRNPACVVAHLKVQHWLYSLALRFVPAADYDAAAVRALHRHLQLGEPSLKRRRDGGDDVDRGGVCAAVQACPPLPAALLLRCAPALSPTPAFTDASVTALASSTAPAAAAAEAGTSQAKDRGDGNASPQAAVSHRGGEAGTRQKPWLNYSKPWLLPSLRAAEAKRAASEAAAARRAQEERERNPRFTAYEAQSCSVHDQYLVTSAAATATRDQLRAIKALVLRDVLEGNPVDYKAYATRLRECH